MSGHIWGYAKDIKYMPIDVRYSYLFSLHDHWAMRYSPEVTALAMLDEILSGLADDLRFLAEMTAAEKDAMSHRGRALRSLARMLAEGTPGV